MDGSFFITRDGCPFDAIFGSLHRWKMRFGPNHRVFGAKFETSWEARAKILSILSHFRREAAHGPRNQSYPCAIFRTGRTIQDFTVAPSNVMNQKEYLIFHKQLTSYKWRSIFNVIKLCFFSGMAHRFSVNESDPNFFRTLLATPSSILVGGRNNLYNISAIDLQETVTQVRDRDKKPSK